VPVIHKFLSSSAAHECAERTAAFN